MGRGITKYELYNVEGQTSSITLRSAFRSIDQALNTAVLFPRYPDLMSPVFNSWHMQPPLFIVQAS